MPSDIKVTCHVLKTDSVVFDAVLEGDKTFEFRKNDRDFRMGDLVVLLQCEPEDVPTGGYVLLRIGYVLRGPSYGVPDGYAVFSLLTANDS